MPFALKKLFNVILLLFICYYVRFPINTYTSLNFDSKNHTKQKVSLFESSIYFIFVLLISNANSFVYVSAQGYVLGEGFGNSGLRFKSLALCNNGIHYFEELSVLFDSGEDKKTDTKGEKIGKWKMDFKAGDASHLFQKEGDIIGSSLKDNSYVVVGKENVDNLCDDVGDTVIFYGKCGTDTPIHIAISNGERVGSTIPPSGNSIYYVFGSHVICH